MPNENANDDVVCLSWIASEIEERSPLISAFGGLESFCYNNSKIEWVVDDADADADNFGLEYNYSQVFSLGAQDPDAAIAEFTAIIEDAFIGGQRYAGNEQLPSLAGGILYFITKECGAHTTEGNGATLLISDIEDALGALPADPELVLICGASAATYLERMKWSKVQSLCCQYLPKTDILLLRKKMIKIGHCMALGRPHIWSWPPGAVGGALYADLTFMVNGIETMGHLTGFKVELPL